MALSPAEIDEKKLYSVDETARLLEVSSQTIRKHLKKRSIKARKIGRRWLIRGTEIRKFIGE